MRENIFQRSHAILSLLGDSLTNLLL